MSDRRTKIGFDVIVEDFIDRQILRSALAEVFELSIEHVAIAFDVTNYPQADVVCLMYPAHGEFSMLLKLDTRLDDAPGKAIAIARRLAEYLETRLLISDDSPNPYTMLLLAPGAEPRHVSLDVAALQGEVERFVIAAEQGDQKPELEAQLAAHFPLLYARFLASDDPRHDWLRAAAAKLEFVPLYWDWVAAMGFAGDGRFVRWDHDDDNLYTVRDDQLRPLTDEKLRLVTLVEGAKDHPELKPLIPKRPRGARDCATCSGTGTIAALPQMICVCGGVGWLV